MAWHDQPTVRLPVSRRRSRPRRLLRVALLIIAVPVLLATVGVLTAGQAAGILMVPFTLSFVLLIPDD